MSAPSPLPLEPVAHRRRDGLHPSFRGRRTRAPRQSRPDRTSVRQRPHRRLPGTARHRRRSRPQTAAGIGATTLRPCMVGPGREPRAAHHRARWSSSRPPATSRTTSQQRVARTPVPVIGVARAGWSLEPFRGGYRTASKATGLSAACPSTGSPRSCAGWTATALVRRRSRPRAASWALRSPDTLPRHPPAGANRLRAAGLHLRGGAVRGWLPLGQERGHVLASSRLPRFGRRQAETPTAS